MPITSILSDEKLTADSSGGKRAFWDKIKYKLKLNYKVIINIKYNELS